MQQHIIVVAMMSKATTLTAAVLQRACTGLQAMVAVLHFCSSAGLYELQQHIIVVAMMSKAVATLLLTAAVLQRACTGL